MASFSRVATRHYRLVAQARCSSLPISAKRTLSTASSSSEPLSSVNESEIAFFSRLSSLWWDEAGEFAQLHKMNPIRVGFIREKLLEVAREEQGEAFAAEMENSSVPLKGMDVLDVGCGGGLLSETLARMGARTTGIDASASNIKIASLHASADPRLSNSSATATGSLTYRNMAAENLLKESKKYDAVCSLEVLEHVDNPRVFLQTLGELVKPGGHLFLSTIARTPLSYFLTIFAAEQALRLVEPGTHTHSKYINPTELVEFFQNHRTSPHAQSWITRLHNYSQDLFPTSSPSRKEAEVRGLIYVPWKGTWELMSRSASVGVMGWATTQCNYIFWVRKPLE